MAGAADVAALATRLHLHEPAADAARRSLTATMAAFVHAGSAGPWGGVPPPAADLAAPEAWEVPVGAGNVAYTAAAAWAPPVFASPTTHRPASKLPMASSVSERDSPAQRVAYPVTAIMRTRGVGEWPRATSGGLPTGSLGASTGAYPAPPASASSRRDAPLEVANLSVPSLSVPPPIVKHSVAFSGLAALAGQSSSVRRGLTAGGGSGAPLPTGGAGGATGAGMRGW
jgi:hypothetical protein